MQTLALILYESKCFRGDQDGLIGRYGPPQEGKWVPLRGPNGIMVGGRE